MYHSLLTLLLLFYRLYRGYQLLVSCVVVTLYHEYSSIHCRRLTPYTVNPSSINPPLYAPLSIITSGHGQDRTLKETSVYSMLKKVRRLLLMIILYLFSSLFSCLGFFTLPEKPSSGGRVFAMATTGDVEKRLWVATSVSRNFPVSS